MSASNNNNGFSASEQNDRAQKIAYLAVLKERQIETAEKRKEIIKQDNELRRQIERIQNVTFIIWHLPLLNLLINSNQVKQIFKDLMEQELERTCPRLARQGLLNHRPFYKRLRVDHNGYICIKMNYLPTGRRLVDLCRIRNSLNDCNINE